MPTILLKRLNEDAIVPTRANPTDAGADLYSTERVLLYPGQRKLVGTGWAMEIPEGYYGRIAPRSGNAYRYGIDILAGVIDITFRGEVKVLMINLGNEPVEFPKGNRIAQFITEKCDTSEFIEQNEELTKTERGEGGFGHTGQ